MSYWENKSSWGKIGNSSFQISSDWWPENIDTITINSEIFDSCMRRDKDQTSQTSPYVFINPSARAELFRQMHDKFNFERSLINSTIDKPVSKPARSPTIKTYEKQMEWLKLTNKK